MLREGRAQSQFLVDHKDDIMRKFAEYLFPGLDWPERTEAAHEERHQRD